MSKKEKARWGRVSRGDGAGSSDFLNQLEAYERGEISAKSVKFTRDNPGAQTEESNNERRDERPQKPQHQKPNRPKAPASPLISDAYMEDKYAKKNKDPYAEIDESDYSPHGAPLIEEGNKRTRGEKFESGFQEFGIPLPGDDHTGFEPMNLTQPVTFPGTDGRTYILQNGMVVPISEPTEEPYNDISDILNGGLTASDAFAENMNSFDAEASLAEEEADGVEEMDEEENSNPPFTIEAEFEDIDGSVACLTIADKHTTFSVLTSGCYEDVLTRLEDDCPLDIGPLNYICEKLDIPADEDDYVHLCWFLIMAIVFTRWPAVQARNEDEVVDYINIHTEFPEIIYPSAYYNFSSDPSKDSSRIAILWQAAANFPNVLMEAADYFVKKMRTIPSLPTGVIDGQIRVGFLVCVLEEALKDTVRWMPGYGDLTDGVPVEVEKAIAEAGIAKVQYGNTENLASGMMNYRDMSIIINNLVLDFRHYTNDDETPEPTPVENTERANERVENVQESHERVDAPRELSEVSQNDVETDAEDVEDGDSGDVGIISGEDMAAFGDSVLSAALGEKASSRDATPIVQEDDGSDEDFTVPVRRRQ